MLTFEGLPLLFEGQFTSSPSMTFFKRENKGEGVADVFDLGGLPLVLNLLIGLP